MPELPKDLPVIRMRMPVGARLQTLIILRSLPPFREELLQGTVRWLDIVEGRSCQIKGRVGDY